MLMHFFGSRKRSTSRNSGLIVMPEKMIIAYRRRGKMLENGVALMITNYQLVVNIVRAEN